TPAQSQEHNRHKTTTSQTVGNQADHSEYKQQTTDVDSTTPGGTQQTKPDLSDEQELQLSEHLDKHKRKMIAFPCKTCHTRIHRPTYDNSTTNLSKHVVVCNKKQQYQDDDTHKLVAVGINGTGDIDPREVSSIFVSLHL
ncbi:hypothetical protein PSTG_18552, partial [Puccinia striiformis f. sp. tritici PST-78]